MSNQEVVTRDAHQFDEEHTGLTVQTSLAVSLARAEVDQQVATARALPRSIQRAINQITTLATLDEESAAECIYALPRGGKSIRGPSIRFAEIAATSWGNCRIGARVVHVDRIEAYVEAEGVFQDLETNVIQTARVRRQIQAKRGKGIDNDMIQLAGAAACSIARRNAILAGIPKGVTRRGYVAVEEVMRGDIKTLSERRTLALKAFGVMGVSPDRLFASLGVQGEDDITLDHLLTLTGTRSAIKNGEMTVEEAFPPIAKNGDRPKDLGEAIDKLVSGEKVDPATGEITQQDKPAADNGAAKQTEGESHSAPPAAAGVGTATAAGSAPPQEGAGLGNANDPSPAPTDKDSAVLADLLATGDGRAAGGAFPLKAFLDQLQPEERALIPKTTIDGWNKTAKAVKAAGA